MPASFFDWRIHDATTAAAWLPAAPAACGASPDNYLVWSILVTLFCCLPLGIVAIIKSSQVNGLWAQGRYAEAQASAESAKKFVTWSAGIGVGLLVIYGILTVLGALNANAAML